MPTETEIYDARQRLHADRGGHPDADQRQRDAEWEANHEAEGRTMYRGGALDEQERQCLECHTVLDADVIGRLCYDCARQDDAGWEADCRENDDE